MRGRLIFLLWVIGISMGVFGGGISLSPTLTEIVLPPGSSYQDQLYITNTGDEPIIVEARVLGFMAPEGIPILLEPELDHYPYSGREILKLEPAEQEIDPGQTAVFTYTLNMPETLEPFGGRYVAAVFKVKPPAQGEVQVIVSTQLISLFLVSPGPGAEPHLTFDNVRIYQSPTDPREVILEALVANDGNLHISYDQIIGWIYITDSDGYLVDNFRVKTHTMLPGNKYLHREKWEAPSELPSGTYQFHLDLWIFRPLGEEPQRYHLTVPVELNF